MIKKVHLFFVLPILIGIYSCNKKFDHTDYTETVNPTSCELCNYANTITGQYRGYSRTDGSQPVYDSLTVTLEHIFLNLGPKLDSTIMYFKQTKDFDNKSTHIDTVRLDNHNGIFFQSASPGFQNRMIAINDSLYIYRFVTYHIGQAVLMDFKGKKLP